MQWSRNNRALNGIYLVFSMVLLLIVFLLVLGYAMDISGIVKEKQEKTFSLLLAHRVWNLFDLSRRNGVAATALIGSDAYLFGVKRVRLNVSGSGGSILVSSAAPVRLPAPGSFRLEQRDGFYLLEVPG